MTVKAYSFAILISSALLLIAVPVRSDALDLYAASGQGAAGELYKINPANGATLTDIGPLNDSSNRNFGMTALAFDPVSGVLYGSSGNANTDTTTRGELVSINPASGLVTDIGNFGVPGGTMTDLAFDPTSHVLYGLTSAGGARLCTIDTSTGAATLVGNSGIAFTNGGGIAINSASVLYASPLPQNFGTYDLTTGAYTNIAEPLPKPNGRGFGALKFNGSVLYGLEVGTASHLVTIDTTTAVVTDLGATQAQFLDGLAFAPGSPSLTGDYNNNGTVDAPDYVLWRKYLNTTTTMPNDPIGGTIGTAQYDQWRAHFGQPAGSGAGAMTSATIPEPSTLVLLMFVVIGWCFRQGRAA
jgi:hypothetical protein